MGKQVLSTQNLTKAFGGLVVAGGINFTVEEKEVRCIIGPNGAGKTTFFNLLTGLLFPDSGTIMIDSIDITGFPTYKRQKKGLVRTFQAPHIFPELTVFENVSLSYHSRNNIFFLMGSLKTRSDVLDKINASLKKVNLNNQSETLAGSLSHGEKKRVEMAMAIIQQPKVLLMDEPTAGMTERETMEIADLVHDVRRDMSVVTIEHDMEFVKEIADKITVLYRGELVREGSIGELENDSFIKEIYLGSVEV